MLQKRTPEQNLTAALSRVLKDKHWSKIQEDPEKSSRWGQFLMPGLGYVTLKQSWLTQDLGEWKNSIEVEAPHGETHSFITWDRDGDGMSSPKRAKQIIRQVKSELRERKSYEKH